MNAILSELDPEQQIKDWNKIRTEWLRAIAAPLLSEIDQLLDGIAKIPAPAQGTKPAPGSDPAAAKLEFDKAKLALVSIDTLLASRKVQDAGNAYTEAVTAYHAGVIAMGGTVKLGGPAATGTVAPGSGTDIPPSVLQGTWNAIAFVLGAPTTVAEANKRVLLYEGILFGVLLLVAVAVGLKLLYFDNSSWGSLTDMTVAVLWGFGLHQAGGAAFQGVQSIAQQLPAR